jgi:hypothetical protein
LQGIARVLVAACSLDPNQMTGQAQAHPSSMTRIDWVQLIGIATLLLSAGMICAVLFFNI